MQKLIVIGAGGHGKEIAWTIRRINAIAPTYELVGYCDDATLVGTLVLGVPVLGNIESVAATHGRDFLYICGVGNNRARPELVARAENAGWGAASVIDPSVVIGDEARIGAGVYLAVGVYVGPLARIAGHAFVNVHASVGHDAVVESHVQICPGARISGGVVLRTGVFVGSNAVVAQQVEIGAWSSLSAASFAAASIPGGVVAMGVPARGMLAPKN